MKNNGHIFTTQPYYLLSVFLGTFTPQITMSGTEIRPKEAVLVMLALALLVFSICLFFKHWSKNYRDINTLPYYAYLYKVKKNYITKLQASPAYELRKLHEKTSFL